MAEQKTQNELFSSGDLISSPVECLGMTFASDSDRRNYFLDKLREKLQDPDFRNIEGFPIGNNEDILALSDPPYYTACPNPFLEDFIQHYGKPYDQTERYEVEPFAFDVSEGKTDSIFTAHSYHTKVPHKAIMRYILHYTKPGDLVLDGFSGSGMTGVAAQMCDRPDPDLKYAIESEYLADGLAQPQWGARKAVLNDLGIAATFITANYNLPFDVKAFEREAKRILKELEDECGWMYETLHGDAKGRINYTVWSQVFSCPECSGEVVFLDEALDAETKRVRDSFACPHCAAELTKSKLIRLFETVLDPVTQSSMQTIKRKPVLINYTVGKNKYEKVPDAYDLEIIERVTTLPLPVNVPIEEIPFMHMTHQRARMEAFGITYVHHFFLPRASQALGTLWAKAKAISDTRLRDMLLFFVEQAVWGMSLLNRYQPIMHGQAGGSQVNRYLTGVYYVGSQISEVSPDYNLRNKLDRLVKAFKKSSTFLNKAIINNGTAANLRFPDRSIDYIFTDPPFGENIYYADLNFLVESWHRVKTNAQPEAIVDKAKNKDLEDYQRLMYRCLAEYYRVLKPNRWMTVVFHNSHNAVWNAIQEAMLSAGFVIANVRTLDKQQGSYRQVTSTAVKQDLVITAYKPNGGIEERFELEKGTESGVWDFVQTHLQHLPVFVGKHGQVEVLAERMNYLLFDRMVAFHIQRGATIPMSAIEFYAGLEQRFVKRDDMYFLQEQLNEYDRKRLSVREVLQLELLVTDEESAKQWLRQQLTKRPQTIQEIHPNFTKDMVWVKYEKNTELRQILDENFICYKGEAIIPKQIVSWLRQSAIYRERILQIAPDLANGNAIETDDPLLVDAARDRYYVPDLNQQIDLDKLREKSLLKEFEEYRQSTQKLKIFRLEAIRAGFKKAWSEKNFRTIVDVARKHSSLEKIIQEDEKLLMFYDNALTRLGED
jgi:rubredoxin